MIGHPVKPFPSPPVDRDAAPVGTNGWIIGRWDLDEPIRVTKVTKHHWREKFGSHLGERVPDVVRIFPTKAAAWAESADFCEFGEVSERLGMQSQYASRYVNPFFAGEEYRQCDVGLRIVGKRDDYHFIRIHKDDVAELVRRIQEAKKDL